MPAAEINAAELTALVEKAQALKLAETRQWRRLGHWRPTLFGGWLSEADGPDFFLAAEGKTDPQAELEATLRGMLRPPTAEELKGNTTFPALDQPQPPLQHPVCRLPARVRFLMQRLEIPPEQLPAMGCPRLMAHLEALAPKAVSLVFSSYYLNNPSSAFGHVLIRFHHVANHTDVGAEALLDYSIDFSAEATTTNAVLYAFNGIFGRFRGLFSRVPYFYKVREYNDYESRDLWTYALDLTPEQVLTLALHSWELGSTWFDYYYIDENCAYHVIGLIEAAVPEADLLDKMGTTALPVDAIRAAVLQSGLVKDVTYRPSARSHLAARLETIDPELWPLIRALSERPDGPLPEAPSDQISVLDAAVDLVELEHAEEILRGGDTEGTRLKQALLSRRAAIREVSPVLKVPTPLDQRPHLGHSASRLGIAGLVAPDPDGGLSWGGLLSHRIALHDLLDAPAGYPELAQLEFLPTQIRVQDRRPYVSLDEALLVRIISLSPWTFADQSISWRAELGAQTLRFDHRRRAPVVGYGLVGGGVTFATAGQGLAVYLMTSGQAMGGPNLPEAPARLGVLPEAGLRLRLHRRWVALVRGGLAFYPWQPRPGHLAWARAETRVSLSRDTALSAHALMDGDLTVEGWLGFQLYY